MKITRENYEAYFIDYLEGNLDERLVDDFIEFLQQNHDLKEELALFETISIEPETITFSKKDDLLKEKYDSEKEFDNAAIANLEGDISDKEKLEFDNYLSAHPAKKKDVTLFEKTKLQADESIIYAKKKSLYHYTIGRTVLLWSGRVAAILILAFGIFSIVNNNSDDIIPENQIAAFEEKTTKKVIAPEIKKNIPVETPKKDPIKKKEITPKPSVKKVVPKKKSNKSLRENTRGRMEHEDIAMFRIPIEVPKELNGLTASLNIQRPSSSLATMKLASPEIPQNYYEERLLANVVKEKTGLDKFKFNKITKAGLNLVANISKDKFTYQTNEKGKVTEYSYDSRLLAFSIPTKNESADD